MYFHTNKRLPYRQQISQPSKKSLSGILLIEMLVALAVVAWFSLLINPQWVGYVTSTSKMVGALQESVRVRSGLEAVVAGVPEQAQVSLKRVPCTINVCVAETGHTYGIPMALVTASDKGVFGGAYTLSTLVPL